VIVLGDKLSTLFHLFSGNTTPERSQTRRNRYYWQTKAAKESKTGLHNSTEETENPT
jgi:hypothetical protein